MNIIIITIMHFICNVVYTMLRSLALKLARKTSCVIGDLRHSSVIASVHRLCM